MKVRILVVAILFLILCVGCSDRGAIRSPYHTGYNFTRPDLSLVLPDTLREISGLTEIDPHTVACVQDENGILFLYDLNAKSITEQYFFNINGDYEGITRVGKTIYVLRSDGVLFEIEDYTSRDPQVIEYITGIPANNNEGLCYDKAHQRLLIACKGKIEKGKENKDLRVIYAFDLNKKSLSAEPVYTFDLADIRRFAAQHDLAFPTREKKNKKVEISEPVIRFRTSEIGIHPVTSELYLLSAADHCLFIFNERSEIVHIELLDPETFNKSEGITFFDNGDLIITNEAQDMHPTLLRFNYEF